jgi:hypothetical protein
MKKALFLFLPLAFIGKYVIAQDGGENDLKNFRFGLKATGMITWYKPDDQKKYVSDGTMARGSYGLITDFRLNKVASFSTGIQVDYDGGRLSFKSATDTNFYFLSKDNEFLSRSDSTAGASKYRLVSRAYKTTYLTIPITLKLKTPEIGMLTYFGQFGINASFRLKSRVDDEVNAVSGGPYNETIGGGSKQEAILNTADMNPFRLQLVIGGGAEYNLAGSTSLIFALHWHNGFSNAFQTDSEYLFRNHANNYEPTKQNAKSSAIALTVGILF